MLLLDSGEVNENLKTCHTTLEMSPPSPQYKCPLFAVSPCPGKGWCFHLLPASSPRMMGSWPWWTRSRRARGWGCGGRGSAPSSAHRYRRQGDFPRGQMLSAIVNGDLSRFVLPHQHATPTWGPMLTLPLQLQQPVLVAHHPVFAHHPFFLQPEHFVKLPRPGTAAMIVGLGGRSPRVAPVVLRDVVSLQITIGSPIVVDFHQTQLLHQPVLMCAMHSFH